MNKLFFTVLFFLAVFSDFAQQKNDTTFYDKEKKKIRRLTVYEGKKKITKEFYPDGGSIYQSLWEDEKAVYEISWYKDGKKRREVNYDNGKTKIVQEWFDGGKVSRIENYKTIKEKDVEKAVLDGEYLENYSSGSNKTRGSYKEGKKEGVWTTWYESGNKKDAITYKDGHKEGLSEYWHKNGNKSGEFNFGFVSGNKYPGEVKHGKWIRWNENGKKIEDANYSYDRKNGFFREWYPNGNKKSEIEYKNDLVYGTYNTWFENGNVKLTANYRQEIDSTTKRYKTTYFGKYTEYFDNGNLKSSGNYDNGEKTGKWNEYHSNGQMSSEITFENGRKKGIETHWYANGAKLLEQNNVIIEEQGKKVSVVDGEQIYYHENGKPRVKSFLKEGIQNGLATTWYPNGNKVDEVNYCNGQKCGKYKRWYENGNPKEEREYVTRKEKDSVVYVLEGEAKQFNESGQLIRVDFSFNGKQTVRSMEFHDDGKLKNVTFHFISEQSGYPGFGPSLNWFKNGIQESGDFYINGRPVGRIVSYYINGNIKSIIDQGVNGEKAGYDFQFDQEGEVLSARKYTSYKDFTEIKDAKYVKAVYDSIMSRPSSVLKLTGNENGKWITYYSKNKTQLEGEFVNGMPNSKFLAYYGSGNKIIDCGLKNGILDGPFKIWRPNGKPFREGEYKMGEEDGVFISYFANGNKEKETKRVAGQKMYLYNKEWFENGNPRTEIYYNDQGKQHGPTKSWNDKGKLTLECEFDNGKLVGGYKSYYENGNPRQVKNYKDGLEDGIETTYYEKSGKKQLVTSYAMGKKEGEHYQFFESGKLMVSGVHRNNERDSMWIVYNEDGSEKARTLYRDGIVQREASGLECECIDSTKRKIGFAPLLKQLASLEEVRNWSFNFHAPIGEFYNSLFYIGMQNSSGERSAFYTMDVVAYKPLYLKIPDEQGLKLIFNPCIQTGSLESRTHINVDIEYGNKKETRVVVTPGKMAIEFPAGLLSQWDKKNNKSFIKEKKEPLPSSILFTVKSVDYNSRDLLAINQISDICFPTSQIGNTGVLVDFDNFIPDFNAASTPEAIRYQIPTLYYKDEKAEKSLKYLSNPPDEFTGIFVAEGKLTLPDKFFAERLSTSNVNCSAVMISSDVFVATVRLPAEPSKGTGYIIKTSAGLCELSTVELENKFRAAGFKTSQAFFDAAKNELILYLSYTKK